MIDNTHGEGFSAGEEEKSEESNALLAHAHALNAQTYAQQHTDTQTHTHSQQREPDGYVSLSAARPPHSHAQTHAQSHTHAHKTKLRSTAEEEDEEVPDELVDLSAPHSAPTQHTLNALPSAAAPQQQEDGEWNTFTPSSPHSPHTPTQTQTHTEGETAAHVSVAQKHAELFGEGETRSAAPIGWD